MTRIWTCFLSEPRALASGAGVHRSLTLTALTAVVLLLVPIAAGQENGDHPFSGRVVDAAGKPAAGATVRMLSFATAGEGLEYEVDVTTRTDADGRFRLAVPKRWLRLPMTYRQELGIVAVHEGRAAAIDISRGSLPSRDGLELQIPAPDTTTIAVRSPAGLPVRGAVVKIDGLLADQVNADLTEQQVKDYAGRAKKSRNGYIVTRGLIALPAELHFAVGKTDDAGRVTVTQLAASQIGSVQVESADFGTQMIMSDVWRGRQPGADWPGTIRLQPVGRVRGQLAGTAALAGREVLVRTQSEAKDRMVGGQATVRTDAQGKFEVPRMAAGIVRFRVTPDPKTPDRAVGSEKPPQLKAGGALDVTIDLKPAVRLTGIVLDGQSRKPVADVHVVAWSAQQGSGTLSDTAGRFTLWVAPGKTTVMPLIPAGYLQPVSPDKWAAALNSAQVLYKEIDAAGATMELPPTLMEPEATLHGIVTDADGKALAGTTVSAVSHVFDHRLGQPRYREVAVRADAQGKFAVAGIDPRVAIRLRAQTGSAAKVVTVTKPGKDVVRIAIAPKEVFRIAGRVIDGKGQPVADAGLELWHRDWRPPPAEAEAKKAPIKEAIRTNAQGEFTTPPLLPDGQYRFIIRAAGVKTTESAWLDAAAPETAQPQALTVTRLGGLAGVLRDRQGKPVGDARITLFSHGLRVETATSARGEFKLDAPGGKAYCVIARHPEFRVHGVYYEKEPANLDQVLTRLTEPAEPRTPRTILGKDERQKLLERLLTPYRQQFTKTTKEDDRMRGAEILARVDPEFLLAEMDKKPLRPAMVQDMLRQRVAKQWAPDRPDDAEELIGKIETPWNKALAGCDLADALPAKARAKKIELLAEALVAARTEKSPEFRAIALGSVGRRLFDLGEQERATTVLREGAKPAGGLAVDAFAGYARGCFATDLALIDLPAALAMVKGLKDHREFCRHHGNIAHRIAALQTAAAVKVLDLIPPPRANEFSERDSYAIRVSYRMATVDVPAALKLAETIIDVASRAQAIGVIAQAAARKDRKSATELLRRAYALLEEDAIRPDPPQLTSALTHGSVAAVLIFTAAKIDASLVDECLWRAVALQRTATQDPHKVWYYTTTNNALSLAAACYDAKLAELLLPPPSDQKYARERPVAQFLVHPRRGVEAVLKLSSPDALREPLQLIGYLATTEDQIPRLIHRTLGIWPIDAEDIDF